MLLGLSCFFFFLRKKFPQRAASHLRKECRSASCRSLSGGKLELWKKCWWWFGGGGWPLGNGMRVVRLRFSEAIFCKYICYRFGVFFSHIFLIVHPENWGFMIQFDERIFSNGLVQPPTRWYGFQMCFCLLMLTPNLGMMTTFLGDKDIFLFQSVRSKHHSDISRLWPGRIMMLLCFVWTPVEGLKKNLGRFSDQNLRNGNQFLEHLKLDLWNFGVCIVC